jgi:hypothetical protein
MTTPSSFPDWPHPPITLRLDPKPLPADALTVRHDVEGFISGVGTVDRTLAERGVHYGAFKDGASIMQALKAVMHAQPGWARLRPSQRESLDMIVHKIGRILNGDPNYIDSWHDIQGFAKLVEDELHADQQQEKSAGAPAPGA